MGLTSILSRVAAFEQLGARMGNASRDDAINAQQARDSGSGYPSSATGTTKDRIRVYVRAKGGCPALRFALQGWQISNHQLSHSSWPEPYAVDGALGPAASNQEVYQAAVRRVVASVLEGYNGTVLAYGQTGSGKTYTMRGVEGGEGGVMHCALSEVFGHNHLQPNPHASFTLSYVELYNEELFDLLKNREKLVLREKDGHFVLPCHEEPVASVGEALGVIARHDELRTVARTEMNDCSSRSHTIVRLVLRLRRGAGSAVQESALHLVDLAGSEPMAATEGLGGQQRAEGKHINKSLSFLSKVMWQLSEGQKHVSFRDSQLTRLLKPALGGDSKTALVCCFSPHEEEESRRTLEFAKMSRKVVTSARVHLRADACQTTDLAAKVASLTESLIQKENTISQLEGTAAALEAQLKAVTNDRAASEYQTSPLNEAAEEDAMAQLRAEHTKQIESLEMLLEQEAEQRAKLERKLCIAQKYARNSQSNEMTRLRAEHAAQLEQAQQIGRKEAAERLALEEQLRSAQKAAACADDRLKRAQHGLGLWSRRDAETEFLQINMNSAGKKRGRLSLDVLNIPSSTPIDSADRTKKLSRYSTGTTSLGTPFAFQKENKCQDVASTKNMWELAVPELCVKLKKERASRQHGIAPINSGVFIPKHQSASEGAIFTQMDSEDAPLADKLGTTGTHNKTDRDDLLQQMEEIVEERDSLVEQLKDAQHLIAELKSASMAHVRAAHRDIGSLSHFESQSSPCLLQSSDTNFKHTMEDASQDTVCPVQRSKRRSLAAKDTGEKGGKMSRSCCAWTVEEFAELCEGVRKFDENWDEIETWIIEAGEDAELHDRVHGWKNAQLSLKAKWTSATKAKKKVTPCSVCGTYEFPELILNACSSWGCEMKPAHTFCMGIGCESPEAGWTCKVCQTRGRGFLAKVDSVVPERLQVEVAAGANVTVDSVKKPEPQSVARAMDAVKGGLPACHMCGAAEARVGHPQFMHNICQQCQDFLEPETWDCQSKWRLMDPHVDDFCRYCAGVWWEHTGRIETVEGEDVVNCDREGCGGRFCMRCIERFFPSELEAGSSTEAALVRGEGPWHCFLCRATWRDTVRPRARPHVQHADRALTTTRTQLSDSAHSNVKSDSHNVFAVAENSGELKKGPTAKSGWIFAAGKENSMNPCNIKPLSGLGVKDPAIPTSAPEATGEKEKKRRKRTLAKTTCIVPEELLL